MASCTTRTRRTRGDSTPSGACTSGSTEHHWGGTNRTPGGAATTSTTRPRCGCSSNAVVEDRPLHFLDGLGDLDVTRAGLGAAEGGAAAPDAGALVEDVEAVGAGLVP